MFDIFVQYSTRPMIYDVSMKLFCWLPSVDSFNILPDFLWQPLLNNVPKSFWEKQIYYLISLECYFAFIFC